MRETDFSKRQVLKYVGDPSQLFGAKDYTLNSGKARGVRAVDLKNGSGLEFTVLPDRGMDIAWLSYKGVNFSYIGKPGVVAPEYYSQSGLDFLRSFYAGFLTTCGLRSVGSPSVDEGEELGLHGRIANTPAEEVYSGTEWKEQSPVLKVKGRMREARVFGENLVLRREITCKCGENKIVIEDSVENDGFRKEPLMLLYHFNLGYPVLDEKAYLLAPTRELRPRDEVAAKGVDAHDRFQKPTEDYSEQVFYHDLKADKDGNTCAALINEELGLGVVIRINKNQLSNFTQWKQMGEGEYVLGMEPCNCQVGGRADSRAKGVLEYLEPGEVRTFRTEIEILDGAGEIDRLKKEIEKL